jgi:U32 family peptidase
MNRPELLAPAGDLNRLKTAIDYGADAVYLGGKSFSLRARASNFEVQDMIEAVKYAKSHQSKVFVTVNMIPHKEDLIGLKEYLITLEAIGIDAVIVASYYVADLVKRFTKNMEVHLSTQLSATNSHALSFYKELGVDRVVLARECSLNDVRAINSKNILPTEVFIHGGMCVNISGRCTLSNYMTLRDANRGGCAQSCRWKYDCFDEEMNKLSHDQVLFSMSSKDLNATPVLKDLIKANVVSLKIEGRMKSEYYLATVVGAYRKFIDGYRVKSTDELIQSTMNELAKAENRLTFSGFYLKKPDREGHLYGVNGSGVTQEFLGTVLNYDIEQQLATIQVRNHFEVGMTCEVFGPTHENLQFVVSEIIDSNQEKVSRVYKPMEIVKVKIPFEVEIKDFVRKINS